MKEAVCSWLNENFDIASSYTFKRSVQSLEKEKMIIYIHEVNKQSIFINDRRKTTCTGHASEIAEVIDFKMNKESTMRREEVSPF